MPLEIARYSFCNSTLGNPPLTLDERVWHMRFSPDGETLFAITDQVYQIQWRKKSARAIWRPDEIETLNRGSFSPDGSMFARLSQDTKIHLHETRDGKVLHTFENRAAGSTAVDCFPARQLIAFGGHRETLIHHTGSGALVRKIPQGETDIIALAISPNGRFLVAAHASTNPQGNTIFLHALDREAPPVPLPGTGDRSGDIKFSFAPDSTNLAVICTLADKDTFYLWDLKDHKIIRKESAFLTENAVTHSPDGKLIASCGLNRLEIRETLSGREVFRHDQEGNNEHYWSVAFSPDGQTLALGIEDRIEFFETRTWRQIDADPYLRTPVSALAFSPDGRHLVTGGLNGDIVLWDWSNKKALWRNFASESKGHIQFLSIDPGNTLIGANQARFYPDTLPLSIIDLATGKNREFLPMRDIRDGPILFRPDRKTALIATPEHQLLVCNLESRSVTGSIAIPFLKNSESGKSSTIDSLWTDPADPDRIWWTAQHLFGSIHLKTRAETNTYDGNKAPRDTDPIPPRGHEFINLGSRVWNLPTLHRVIDHGESYDPSARHPGGYLLFTASGTTARVFDVLSQSVIHEIDFGPGEINALVLTPDGKTLVAATTGGVRFVELASARLPAGTTLETLWQVMASDDHWQAYQAAWALARQRESIAFLAEKLPPATAPTSEELRLLQSLLADGNHEVRQTAARQLLDLGQTISPETHRTLRQNGLPSKLPEERMFDTISSVFPEPPPIPTLIRNHAVGF